jgi:hypothetical protein
MLQSPEWFQEASGSTKQPQKAQAGLKRLQKVLKRNIWLAIRDCDARKWQRYLRGVGILLSGVSRWRSPKRNTQGMSMQNVHAVEARTRSGLNHGCETKTERFAQARAPFLKMCTPSWREHRFGPFEKANTLMRFLKLGAKMGASHERNELVEVKV